MKEWYRMLLATFVVLAPTAGRRVVCAQQLGEPAPSAILITDEPPPHQEPVLGATRKIEVQVTAASGDSLYLDKGRAAGIEPGDEVILFPPAAGVVHATVQSVSRSSCRCRVVSGQRFIDIGTRGHVLVPAERGAERSERGSVESRVVPEHPPWTRPPEDWDQSQPLLAPAFSLTPEERAPEMHGHLYAQYLHTWNNLPADSQYSLGRFGASLWYENPMQRGGTLHLDGEFNRRTALFEEGWNDFDGLGRLDRFSYYWGDTPDHPLRFEVGRFLPSGFPEFGLLDGTELVYRMPAGHRVGVSAGYLPEPFPGLVTGEDLQLAAFYRWVSDPEEVLSQGIGFQKTWHRGTPDRDLLIYSLDYDPNEYLSVHGTVWGDFYDGHDTLKDQPFEITEAIVQPIIRISPWTGGGAFFSYVRWPQLLRREYSPFVEAQVVGSRVARQGIFAWHELGDHVRLDGRVDRWNDESDETGVSWESRVSLRDWPIDSGEVALSVFGTHGRYSAGPGGRILVGRRWSTGYASIAYEIADFRLDSPISAPLWSGRPTGLVQQWLRATLDFSIGTDKSVSLFTDYRFGQRQDAVQAGVFFQKRL